MKRTATKLSLFLVETIIGSRIQHPDKLPERRWKGALTGPSQNRCEPKLRMVNKPSSVTEKFQLNCEENR